MNLSLHLTWSCFLQHSQLPRRFTPTCFFGQALCDLSKKNSVSYLSSTGYYGSVISMNQPTRILSMPTLKRLPRSPTHLTDDKECSTAQAHPQTMSRSSLQELWLARARTCKNPCPTPQHRWPNYSTWSLDLDLFKHLDRLTVNARAQNYFFRVKSCLLISAVRGLKNYRLSQRKKCIRKCLFTQDVPEQGIVIMGITVKLHCFSSHKIREGHIQNHTTTPVVLNALIIHFPVQSVSESNFILGVF